MRRLPARRLPVPPGITPSATPVPTSALAACIVVPSPPNTATASTPSATPSAASRRASPGPPVAATSACQPPARSTSTMPCTTWGWVRAAAGLVMRRRRTSVLLLPEEVEAHLVAAGGRERVHLPPPHAGQQRLDAQLRPPVPLEAVLDARADAVVAELAEPAEAGVEGEEPLAADLPPGPE